MERDVSRRGFLAAAGAASIAGLAGQAAAGPAAKAAGKAIKIIGVSCSPRKGKTTAAGLQACLEAAAKVDPGIQTELIELGGMDIPVFDPAAKGAKTDFTKLAPKLSDPAVAGIIIGTPVYFCGMSSLCKAFLDHWMAFRRTFALSGKVGGVLAVGGVRNGGQELAIQSVQVALMCQEMIVVGDGRPTAHIGATLLNEGDDISGDAFGLATARNLGRRVAEVALRLAGAAR
jgi:multimeric flavodoxin WrbA